MTIDQATERYRNDPAFHQVVEGLRRTITELQLTPGEIRDAAMFAAYLVELERPAAMTMHPPQLYRCPECGHTGICVTDSDSVCLHCAKTVIPVEARPATP